MSGDHLKYGIVKIGQNSERPEGTCCQSGSREKLSAYAVVKTY